MIYRRKTNLSEQEWKKFNEELHATLSDKQLLTQNLSANFVAECITKSYQALLEKYMPLRRLSRKERRFYLKPWISSAIKNSIKEKNRLFRIAKRKKNPKYFEAYKIYRNCLTRTKKKAYDNYYKEKIAKYGKNKSKTWKIINEIAKRKRASKKRTQSIAS